ncbi:MAG: carbohydrate ABC transporter permease [Butyrivibrio sp.]|uniref:carbohydrate ABC transporter permease n=1 Tax=Butyrivibrio sp. TaxID=28121 RepID=UPI001B0542D7|nr:carbohydrate ABC transporter permease [Butyrivibrio sp.]MBO6239712.1 carbohydrate ABC transporter permease [Butyrivibrio sp.]
MKNRKISLNINSNTVFYICNTIFLLFCFLIVVFPLLNVVSSSFSSPAAVSRGQVGLLPKGFNLEVYKLIFSNNMLLMGYRNSIIYTFVGTVFNIVLTIMAAYPLAVKDFVGRKVISMLFVFVMIFSAPLIPTYLNVKELHLLDSMWALVLPGAISVYNMIIARTYFQNSIPSEMLESARLEGCDDIKILTSMVLPLSKSIIAVLVLYYAIAHWNSYFDAFIYLSTDSKFPLQVVLRNIMSSAKQLEEMATSADQSSRAATIEVMKYAIIVVGSLPLIILYPFVQKHFVKGVMIGSVKG